MTGLIEMSKMPSLSLTIKVPDWISFLPWTAINALMASSSASTVSMSLLRKVSCLTFFSSCLGVMVDWAFPH